MTNNNAKKRKSNSFKSFISNKKNIPICVLVVFLVFAFLFAGVSVANQKADISRKQAKVVEMKAQCEAQEKENEELQAVLDNENKDDYIEQKAREKGYVKSDEIVFYDISASE